MAKGLGLISTISKNQSLAAEFEKVFAGFEFKSTTYQKNRRFWTSLPCAVRLAAERMPRNAAGLWTTWRRDRPEWKAFRNS
jgi:hypothetical protein